MMEEIKMVRGDTLRFKFQRTLLDGTLIKEKVDEMYITFKKRMTSQEFSFQKRLSDNTIKFDEETGYYHIVIEPKDTESLRFGEYVFDVEITKDEFVKTIMKGILILEEEVTWASNKGGNL